MSHPLKRILRSSIPGLVALLLLAGPAAASSDPFDPVPRDHWAYPALEALQSAGLLEQEPLAPGGAGLTRYEVAGLVSQAEQELGTAQPGGSEASQAEVALAWLYRSAQRLGGDSGDAGEAAGASPLDRLQAGRQLYWLVPATTRLEQEYRAAAAAGSSPAAPAVVRQATALQERLLQQVPPSLATAGSPEVDQLELALVDRFSSEARSPSEVADQVGRTSQALLELRSGFGPELRTLGLDRQTAPELPPPSSPDVVTLDELRQAARSGGLEPPAGGAGLETRVPLGSAGTLEARVGLDRAPGESAVRPGVDVGLGLGEAQLHAGWRLLDFSEGRPGQAEGQAGLDLRF
ncbi:hypothetical protein [Limnochorda pilosa]|uniref:SLH domain-containing protein n=1 Tax=Limnochorda pilosa TaxID=1555112 RepID=A0A0K2SP50_LIMPI|nr:hypothetical protein [Limnochorda pilosa]BAS28881.1 hypothetical protein LIP_3052 [Limnochorda pilosa]